MATAAQDFFVSFFPDLETKGIAVEIQMNVEYSLKQGVRICPNPNYWNTTRRPNLEILARKPFVVFLMNKEFLTSRVCMYELALTAAQEGFDRRVMAVFMPKFSFKRTALLDLKRYWEKEADLLGSKIATLEEGNGQRERLQQELKVLEFILAHAFLGLASMLPHNVVPLGQPSDPRLRARVPLGQPSDPRIRARVRRWIAFQNPSDVLAPKVIDPPVPLPPRILGDQYPRPLQQLLDDMVLVEGGTFMMGDDTKPQYTWDKLHPVQLDDFRIARYPVTQSQWREVMNSNPSYFADDLACPVENVSWNECQDFILRLNALLGTQFRLPTEAEWEYAARGGQLSNGYRFAGSPDPLLVAWHRKISQKRTHPVGVLKPNELGLYDMSGNVWEWCEDGFEKKYYGMSPLLNPRGNPGAGSRVTRGGSWFLNACTLWMREHCRPSFSCNKIGLRLAMNAPIPTPQELPQASL